MPLPSRYPADLVILLHQNLTLAIFHKNPSAMIDITNTDIRRAFDSGAYVRGSAYQSQGRVVKLSFLQGVDDDGDHSVFINGVVRGSGRSQYQQEVQIWKDEDGIAIDSDCTCPVGFNCKHVVAVCMEYQFNLDKKARVLKTDERDCINWLSQLQAPQSSADISEFFVAYVLKLCTRKGIVQISFLKVKPLKSGKGLSKGTLIRPHVLLDASYNDLDYISHEDESIGMLMRSCQEGYQGMELVGEVGQIILHKIAETGRGFYQDTNSKRLSLGEPRDLDLAWHFNKAKDSELKLSLKPDAMVLLTQPCLYLDEASVQIGPLNTALSMQQMKALLNAPVIPKRLQAKVAKQLLNSATDLPIPPLTKRKVKELNNIKPQPCLMVQAQATPSTRQYSLRLRFAYEQHQIKGHAAVPWVNFEHKGQLLRIERDINAEQLFVDTLQGLNFVATPRDGHITRTDTPNDKNELLFQANPLLHHSEQLMQWQQFLTVHMNELKAQGWQVETDESFELDFLDAQGDWHANIEGDSGNDWFELRFDLPVENGQKKIPLLGLISELLEQYGDEPLPETIMLATADQQYLAVKRSKIQPILDILYELHQERAGHDDTIKLSRHDASRLDVLNDSELNVQWHGGQELLALGKKLNDFEGIQIVEVPTGLEATLRKYQRQGLNWLQFLREYQFNGILADDMGLGKTIQALAHLQIEKEQGRMKKPCLILAPTSLMGNWSKEAARFTPGLKVLVLHGPQRHDDFKKIKKHDLIITTYPLLVRDEAILLKQKFHYLLLDEAQVIKNAKSKAAQAVRGIKAEHRLCLTGTPMENHLGELWSLFDFLMPGFLKGEKAFNNIFRSPIEKQANEERRVQLAKRVAPFMLRRTKHLVAKELPEKTEIIQTVRLQSKQAALYESIRLSMEKRVRDAIAKKGLAGSHITILDALLKLRQVCCDPQLLPLEKAGKVKDSAKLELLMSMVPEMVEEGRKILIFSQFSKMLGLIEEQLKQHNISYSKLTGQTRKRQETIDAFKQGHTDVFLISLKAGGVGLNLTEADTVIHYDPWWNPAAENQASDRAHRLGQDKPVFVYKLITENTLEEKILDMQARKQALADGVYSDEKQVSQDKLSVADLQALLAPL